LLHPHESVEGQGRDIRADEGFETNVARFRQEHRTEAHTQLAYTGLPFTDVGKFRREARTGIDFQQDFREIHPGQEGLHLLTERKETGWLVHLVEARQNETIPTLMRLQAHRGIGAEVARGPLVGGLELLGKRLELGLGAFLTSQGAADLRPHRLPLGAVYEFHPRVAPAFAGWDEDITPA
jgi:hypothetical protein